MIDRFLFTVSNWKSFDSVFRQFLGYLTLLANCRWCVGDLLTNRWPTGYRQLTKGANVHYYQHFVHDYYFTQLSILLFSNICWNNQKKNTYLSSGRGFIPSMHTIKVGLLPRHLCSASTSPCCIARTSLSFFFISRDKWPSSLLATGRRL